MEDTYKLGSATYTRGSALRPDVQAECLRRFVHRFTAEHIPDWACKPRPDGTPYPVQFASDSDWLEHSHFAVKKDGRLDGRVTHCQSAPTWPGM